MRFNRTLAFGIVGCLVAGLLIGASQATIQGSVDDSPMTIPNARIGDRVTYVHFERPNDLPREEVTVDADTTVGGGILDWMRLADTEQVAAGGSAGTVSQAEMVIVRTHEAVGLEVVMDKTTERHDVVAFSSNYRSGDDEDSDADHTHFEYVDLATRLGIQQRSQLELSAPFEWTLSTRSYERYEPSVPGLEFQGKTIRLGDDLTPQYLERRALLESEDEFSAEGDGPQVVSFSERQWVADRALIDDRDAYAIRAEQRVTLRLSEEDRAESAKFFGKRLGETATAASRQTTWVTADVAYPILIESRVTVESGGVILTLQDSLLALQEARVGGATVVPWGQDQAAHHFREANPNVERTPAGRLYPADGSGSRLAYPLSRAVSDVENDPRMVQFQLWRQQNPTHYLVAADLSPGERDSTAAATHMWRLVFATPRGEGFEVTTERVHPAAPPVTESRGDIRVPSFDVADLPVESVTIATVERYWIDGAGDAYKGKTPNYVHWGLLLPQSSGAACVSRSFTQTGSNAPVLRMLSVGYTNEGGCIENPQTHDESSLTVDTQTGNLLHQLEWRIDWNRQIIGGYSQTYKPVHMGSKASFDGFRPPDVERAAVASTSLLAAFLVLYFLPALKFLGFKGLLLVPGYAKLRKEELLDNKIRDQILQVVRNDPGVHTTDLAQRVDAGWGTTVYHLGVLEKNGLVSSLVDGRYHRFFPVGTVDFSARGQLAVMKNARTKTIYELIAQDPGIVQESLAARVGISPPAAIFHLKRLEEVGMVGRVKKGRKVHYYANQEPPALKPNETKESMEVA